MLLPARLLLVLLSLNLVATRPSPPAQQAVAPNPAPSPTVGAPPSTAGQTAPAATATGGPFGLRMGMSKAEANAGKELSQLFMFRIPSVPQPMSSFTGYVARIPPKSGLCRVGAGTDVLQSDAQGTELRSRFQEIRAQLEAVYGASQLVDRLRQSALKREPSEWMKSLFKGERTLAATWSKERKVTLPDGVRLIRLAAAGSSETSGFVGVEYEFDNTAQCEIEVKVAMAKAAKPPIPLWETTPLLLDGTRFEQLPGAQLTWIRPSHVLDGDTFAFYANIKQEKEWAQYLLGWHRGQTIVLAGDARDKNAIVAAVASPLRLQFRKEGTSWTEHRPRVEAARGKLFIDEDARPLMFASGGKVHLWEGRGLSVALGPGDQVEFAGKKFVVADAELVGTNAQAGALIAFKTASPQKAWGLGVHDGSAFRAIVVEDELLPGSSDATLSVSTFTSAPEDPLNAILTDDGGIVWRVFAKSGGKKTHAIFYFSTRETRNLLAEDDPRPEKPEEKIRVANLKVVAARGAENVMVSSSGDHYLLSKTGWRTLPLPRSASKGVWITVKQAFLPTSDVKIAVFRLGMDIAANVSEAATQQRFDVAVCDGSRCQVVYAPKDFAESLEPLPAFAPYQGWLAADWDPFKGAPPASVLVDRSRANRSGAFWGFLSSEDWRRGFLPVPALLTSEGSDIPLEDVGGWVSADEAIARLSGDAAPRPGVYRLRRVPESARE